MPYLIIYNMADLRILAYYMFGTVLDSTRVPGKYLKYICPAGLFLPEWVQN